MQWACGTEHLFHPLWLRESSDDPDYRHAGTKMRIPQASALPLDIRVTHANANNSTLTLYFSDGHSCQFDAATLLQTVKQQRPKDLTGQRSYWDASLADFKIYTYDALRSDEAMLLDAMNEIGRIGLVKVEGIPLAENALMDFARLVGPPRETNWGTITDVRNIPNPYDLTMTARSLSPHVDNPYRLPGPGYIFMHCLRNDADGGESTIVDGYGAANRLRHENPEAFETLTSIAPNFRYADDSAVLEDYGPMIGLDTDGEIARIRFSNRTEQVPALSVEQLGRYYSRTQGLC